MWGLIQVNIISSFMRSSAKWFLIFRLFLDLSSVNIFRVTVHLMLLD